MNYRIRNLFWILFIYFTLSGDILLAQSKINFDWIFSLDAYQLSVAPNTQWTTDSKVIFTDNRNVGFQRKLEIYDPENNTKRPAFEMEDAVQSLIRYLGDDTPGYVGIPEEINSEGKRGLYDFKGDLFLLDFNPVEFSRITETISDEISARFSPDGDKIAYVRDNNLYYFDLSKKLEYQITSDGDENILNGTLSWVYWEEVFGRQDIGYWWSDDSRSIAFFNTDETGIGTMIYVDTEPAIPDITTQKYPKAGSVNPVVKLGIYDTQTGKIIWPEIDNNNYEYLIRVKWLPDNQRVSVQTMNRQQTEVNLYFIDKDTGKCTHILKETDPAWVNIHDDLHFLRESNRFIWASERTGFMHLYLYNLDGQLINPITSGKWAVTTSGDQAFWIRQSICYIDEDKQYVYFTALKKSSLERHLYRTGLDGRNLIALTEKSTGTHGIIFSPDGRYYLDEYTNQRQPWRLNMHNTGKTDPIEFLEADRSILENYEIRFPELTSIPASDGFQLPAAILKPPDFNSSDKYPVIMYVYSGPSAPAVGNKWDHQNYWNNILSNEGYITVIVDNRSATGISKQLENTILHNSPSEELKDIVDAVKWLGKQDYIDKERIGIWGWSGGGSMTLAAMTQSKAFKAGIAVAAVSDWRYYDTKYSESYMKSPQDNPEGYKANSHVRNAPDLHGRLLLVHGTFDDNVHIQNAYAFADMLIVAGITFDMMIYPGRDHGIADYPARIHLYKTMLEFWKKNL